MADDLQKGDRVRIKNSTNHPDGPMEGVIISERTWNGCWHVRVDGRGRWPFDVAPSDLEAI